MKKLKVYFYYFLNKIGLKKQMSANEMKDKFTIGLDKAYESGKYNYFDNLTDEQKEEFGEIVRNRQAEIFSDWLEIYNKKDE